jgi:TolA-binding protein
MPLPEESIIGHKEKPLEPEKQIDFLRRYLRGEKRLTYSNPGAIIFAARVAVDKAMDVVYTIGNLKGQRKYTNYEIDEMRAEFHRLEDLLKRKNSGENIEKEIDDSSSEKNIDAPLLEKENEEPKKKAKPAKKAEHLSDIPEIAEIKTLIDDAVAYYSKNSITKANKTFEEAIEKIKKAKSKGIDVTDVEREIKSLNTFFQNQ